MTYTASGSVIAGAVNTSTISQTIAFTPAAAGNCFIVATETSSGTNTVSTITGTNTTAVRAVQINSPGNILSAELWIVTVGSGWTSGAITLTITWAATVTTAAMAVGQQLSAGLGANTVWQVDTGTTPTASRANTTASTAMAFNAMTGSATGLLAVGFAVPGGSSGSASTAGSTSGSSSTWVWNTTADTVYFSTFAYSLATGATGQTVPSPTQSSSAESTTVSALLSAALSVTPISASNPATVVDTPSTSAQVSASNPATVADTVSTTVAASAAQPATVTDSAVIAIPVPASDTATVVDAAVPAATVGDGDAPQVTDVAASTASPSLSDSVTAADSATIAIPINATDTITATDTKTLTSAVAGFDTATVVDSPSVVFPGSVSGNDPATITDNATVAAATTGPDLVAVSDAASISIPVPAADTSTASDTATLTPLVLGVDAASIVDTASSIAAGTGVESGVVGDSATTVAPTAAAQTVALSDGFTVGVALPADPAAAADVPSSTAQVGTPDILTARDGATVDVGVADLVVAAFLVDPTTGSLVALPEYKSITFGRKRDGISSLSMVYPVTGLNFGALYNATIGRDSDAEVEIWSVGSAPGMRFLVQEASGDDVKENSDWTFAGSSLELRMSDAEVWPQSTTLTTDVALRINFAAATPGGIVRTLLTQAQSRGALTDITADFTSLVDTDGVAWPNVLTAHWAPAITYDSILAKLVSLGLIEWSVDWNGTSRVLHMWAPQGRGTDRSIGNPPVVLRRGRNLTEAPRKWSVKNSATAVLASGSAGLYQSASDGGALSRRGRRVERSASAANLSDTGAVLAYAQTALSSLTPGTLEVTHGLGFLPSEPRPIISFDIGDYLYSQTGTTLDRLRVVEWTLSLSDSQLPSGTVTLNDSQTESLIRIQDRLDALNNGDAVVGTSTSTVDTGIPTPPTGIVASSVAYLIGADVYSSVTVGWSPPVLNVDGSTITDLAGYNIQYAVGTGPYQVGSTVSSGSATSGSFTAAPGQTIHIQVRAFDQSGNASAWSSPATDHTTASDVTAPPVTSAPTVANYLGVLKIAWDGLTSTSGGMVAAAPDFDHVEVHVSTASGFTPSSSTYFDRLYAAGIVVYTDGVYGTTYYAKLVAVDGSGNQSVGSAQGSDSPAQVVSGDVFDGAIGTAKLADAAITTAKINDLAVNDAKIGNLSVGKLTAGILSVAVTLSGSIKTAATGQRVEMDTAGLRIYNSGGTQTVGLNPATFSFFLGEIRTAASGQRMVINPGGAVPDTINVYPSGGGDFARVMARTAPSDGSAAILIDGGAANGTSRGRLGAYKGEAFVSYVTNDTGGDTSAGFSLTAVSCGSSAINTWAQSKFLFNQYSGSSLVSNSQAWVMWAAGSISSCPVFGANAQDSGIKLDSGTTCATNAIGTLFGPMKATAFTVASSGDVKTDIVPVKQLFTPLDVVAAAPARAYKYTDEVHQHGDAAPMHFGPIAEELPADLVRWTPAADGSGLEKSVDVMAIAGTLWSMVGQLLARRITSTTATCAVPVNTTIAAGATIEVACSWESSPLATPTDAIVFVNTGLLGAGKVTAWAKPGSITSAGCVVVFRNTSATPVKALANALAGLTNITATVVGQALYTPPAADY